jgi:hypothetical protein
MPANYVLIGEVTLGVTATSVTFSNIPQTGYTDLKVIVSGRFSSGAGFNLIDFNGLSTANFSNRILEGNGASATSFVSGNTNYAGALNGSGDTANTFSNEEIYIPNYAGSTFKSISFDAVMENNGTTAYQDLGALLWSNTAAITSIRLTTHTGAAYAVGSSFSLYGIAALGITPTVLPKASGGDIVVNDGTYWYHAFLASGVFMPSQSLSCDALVVAGGGGAVGEAGGGGAGGLRSATQSLTATNYAVIVGAGGRGTTGTPTQGSSSSFNSLQSAGGGAAFAGIAGGSGGSGAGGGTSGAATSGGAGNTPSTSPSQGNNGGNNGQVVFPYPGGGGGGAGAVGQTPTNQYIAGNGGAGVNTFSTWASATNTGASGFYAGGGGGGVYTNSGGPTAGSGGSGGGGAGGLQGATATSGTVNTGGGGGGSGQGGSGGAGGSGIVIVRYTMA